MIKFFAAQVLHDVVDNAIQVHGAAGSPRSIPSPNVREARAARI